MRDARHSAVIIIPVHNRRELTLAALRDLAVDGVLSWATVLVVDDGSTDGTTPAIRAEFPEVAILPGTGQWWWGGAIRHGMEWALERNAECIFWLNDDCRPPPGSLAALRNAACAENAVKWITAESPEGWSYGAHRKTAWTVRRCDPAEEAGGQIDAFSGNCVCLPRSWIDRVGLPDAIAFPHGFADLDYALRLRRAGAPLSALSGYTAMSYEPGREASERWLASNRRMRDIWRDFSSPRSYLYFPAWRRFALRHWGPIWGCIVFAAPYVRWAAIAGVRVIAPRRTGLSRDDPSVK